MTIGIQDFNTIINDKFNKETNYFYFGLVSLDYKPATNNLTVKINHYSNQNLYFVFTFNNIFSYRLMEEQYLSFYDDEKFEINSFFAVSDQSRFETFCLNNSLLITQDKENLKGQNTKTYRLLCQNNFIDIFTNQVPELNIDAIDNCKY